NVSGNLIWMIEASGNNILGEIPDNQFDTYRVLNIRETDSHIYEIEGLQYDINKFNQIESGFSFVDTVIQTDYTIPPGPTGLILYTEDIGDNSKYIHYKFTPPSNLSNISNFRVFLKTSPFSVGDENGVRSEERRVGK